MNTGWCKNFIRAACKIILLIIFIFSTLCINAQQTKIDSLKNELALAKQDTIKIILLEQLAQTYRDEKKIDSSILTNKQALELNQKINYSPLKQCYNISTIDYLYYITGNYAKSLEYVSKALILSESLHDLPQMAHAHQQFGFNYIALGDYRQGLNHYFKAKELFERHNHPEIDLESPAFAIVYIGYIYLKLNQPDSALTYVQSGYKLATTMSLRYVIDFALRIFGDIFLVKNNDQLALNYYRQYTNDFYEYNENNRDIGFVYNNMSKIFQKRNQIDSAIFYAKKAFANAQEYQDQENLFTAATLLSGYYDSKDEHAAFSYFKTASQAKDSMISSDKLKQTQLLSFNEQIREKEKQEADVKETARTKLIIIISAFIIFLITFLLWNRIKQLRVRHTMILEQKEAEKLRAKYEKELLGLEAKALRAQMNPHFIFNCLNSIKSLIQQHEEEKSVTYLTTFSKLIRTLFNNADRKEISLFDEIETCKLYLQLEAMRFSTKFSFSVNVDDNIDLKSTQVPALIIQPFIENAIWHGIVPNDSGHISLNVLPNDGVIEVIIDDNGIGREASQKNKSAGSMAHQSKGVNLTQSRLELNNLLQQRQAKLEIIDKKDLSGIAIGTTVIIKIKEEL